MLLFFGGMMSNLRHLLALILLVGTLAACDHDDDEDVTEVVRLSLDQPVVRVGEETVARVGVSFSEQDVFGDGDNIILIARIPAGLTLKRGTSEVQGDFEDEDIGAQIFNCQSGETALVFNLDDNDLRFADNPSGDSNAEISFTLVANTEIENGIISAIALEDVFFSPCDDSVAFDAQTQIAVTGVVAPDNL